MGTRIHTERHHIIPIMRILAIFAAIFLVSLQLVAAAPPNSCAPVRCRMFCFYGWAKGPNGCPVCKCAGPAAATADDVKCPPLCRMMCFKGFVRDQNGCAICKCKS